MTTAPFRFQDEEEDSYFNELRNKALSEKEDPGPFIRFLENIFPWTKGAEAPYSDTLNYTPADTQELVEKFYSKENSGLGFQKTVKKEYADFNGKGPGTLYLSDKKGVPTFNFFPKPPEEWIANQNLINTRSEFAANFFIHTAPVTTPFAMKTVPTNVVLQNQHGTKIKGPLPGSKGGKTLLQQRRDNNYIRRYEKELKKAEFVKNKGLDKVNTAQSAVNDVYNMSPIDVRAIVTIAKKNKISYKQAEAYLEMLRTGVKPNMDIKPGSSMTKQLKEGTTQGSGSVNEAFSRIMKIKKDRGIDPNLKNMLQNNTGLPGRGKNESYPDYSRRILTTYGARPDVNGELVMTSEAFANIKNSSVKREVAQLLLTDINQGVKGSFLQESKIKNKKLNQDLAAYNKKYGARADLHHGYPSVIGIEFFLDIPYMGTEWKRRMAIANKYGNFPGQPMVEGKDNLTSLPSSIPSTITKRKSGIKRDNPAYVEAKEGLEKEGRKIPQHIHQIIHDSFLTNEMGQSGKKFWEKWDPIIIQKGEAGWLEAYEAYNEIIARNRAMYMEALAQLDIFFSKASLSENPEKLVELLEEYISKGKITIGQGLVRDKDGNVVITKEGTDTALSTMKFKEYQQDAVQYIVEDALRDFKKDANKLLENDPRLKDVAAEVAEIPGLTQAEIKRAEFLLFKIKYYNSILLTDGKSRAYQVTRISAAQHKKHVDEYYDLIQLKLPIEVPKGFIQLSVFKNTKLPDLNKQLELILDQQLELDL